MRKNDILDLSPEEVRGLAKSWGMKRYVADQILVWLYRKRVTSFDEMTNVSKAARNKLDENFVIGRLEIIKTLLSRDGTKKYLFRLADREFIEGVLMPINKDWLCQSAQQNRRILRSKKVGRLTLCISTQVGCAMGCKFCRTAELALKRNLTPGEIVGQYLEVQRFLGTRNEVHVPRNHDNPRATSHERRVTNVVLMGMGEPFHNYDNVIRALKILADQNLCAIGRNKITLSTCGLIPEIGRFKSDSVVKLAVSLNAATDKVRDEIMPINRRYPLSELMAACKGYTKGSRHKVTFEYVMFGGVNDSLSEARELVRLISHIPCKVNLIPFNSYPGTNFRAPDEEGVKRFYKYLYDKGFQVNIRESRGEDIAGACGQLCPCVQNAYL